MFYHSTISNLPQLFWILKLIELIIFFDLHKTMRVFYFKTVYFCLLCTCFCKQNEFLSNGFYSKTKCKFQYFKIHFFSSLSWTIFNCLYFFVTNTKSAFILLMQKKNVINSCFMLRNVFVGCNTCEKYRHQCKKENSTQILLL